MRLLKALGSASRSEDSPLTRNGQSFSAMSSPTPRVPGPLGGSHREATYCSGETLGRALLSCAQFLSLPG